MKLRMRRPTRAFWAALAVAVGAIVTAVGVGLELGLGFGLIVAGVATTAYGLTAVDVG